MKAADSEVSHIDALDGLRGLAILAVIFHHVGAVADDSALGALWNNLVGAGWIGVDLFFVLSSFLITRGLLAAKGSSNFFRAFYLKRVLRIFPVYFGFLLAYWLLVWKLEWVRFLSEPAGEAREEFASLWLFWPNILIAQKGAFLANSFNHFWTLGLEEQFYLAWPLLVWWLNRRRLIALSLALCLGAVALRCANLSGEQSNYAAYVLLPFRMDSFAFGALAACLSKDWRKLPAVAAGAGAAVVAGLWCFYGRLNPGDYLVQAIGYSALGLLAAGLILLASREGWLAKGLRMRGMRKLGTFSFALYVFHNPLHIWLSERFPPATVAGTFGNPWLGMVVYSGGLLAASLLIAWLSYHLVEKHFLRMKPKSQ